MVRAVYAGSGKSYACKAMEQRGHKVLFVCPTNKLVQNNRESGVTLNKFFGIGMSVDGGMTRLNKFNDKPYDVIVFDEIYFASVHMLSKIKRYSERNPDKII
jgi:superfamily II DNA or RNA helicase